MALFGKKNKNNNTHTGSMGDLSPEEYDRMIELGAMGKNPASGSMSMVPPSAGDFDGQDLQFSGMNQNYEDRPQEKKKGDKGKVVLSVAAVIIGALVALGAYGHANQERIEASDTATSQDKDKDKENKSQKSEENSSDAVSVVEKSGKAYKGSENGDRSTGSGAILAFDYAYYVLRDGERVREIFNPDIPTYSASSIQAKIDEMSQGTSHELSITPVEIGKTYDVVLTINIPGQAPMTSKQKFHTMNKDGKYYVEYFTSEPLKEKSK